MPGSRRVLQQSLISKYDVKKNVVQIVDRFPERLIDAQKAISNERKAAAAATTTEDRAGAALASGKVPGEKAAEASALEEAPAVAYAIPWIDYLARSMPLCVAAGGLESRDLRFLLENCLRIPPSGNVPGPRPASRPRVLLEASPDEGFPPDVVSVQLIVPAASISEVPLHQPAPAAPAGASLSRGGGGSGVAAAPESRLLSSSESLLDRPMPVVDLQRRGEAGALGGREARGVGAEGRGGAAAAEARVAQLEVIGVWRKEWPPRGQVRAVLGSGEEVRCQYRKVQGVVSVACPPGPCAFSQVCMCVDLCMYLCITAVHLCQSECAPPDASEWSHINYSSMLGLAYRRRRANWSRGSM